MSASPADATLVFCRTPLQSLIGRRIIDARPGAEHTLVYAPVSPSPKHRHYFDRLEVADKAFIPFFYRFSDALSELLTYFRIPERIRARSFDTYLVSSFNSLAFALLAGREGQVMTFDDGSLSYNREMLEFFMAPHRGLGGLIRRGTGSRSAAEIVAQARTHFTIFPPEEIGVPVDPKERISLFDAHSARASRAAPITILLGTAPDVPVNSSRPPSPGQVSRWQDLHACAVRIIAPDLYLPHPHTAQPAQVCADHPDAAELERLAERMIAEELVAELAARGHAVRLYSFSSTALIVLRDVAACTNLVIDGFNSDEVALFDRLHVPSIRVTDLGATA